MTNPPPPGTSTTRTVRKTQVRRGNDLATNLGIFATTFLLSLGGGYLMFNQPQKPAPATDTPAVAANTPTTTPPAASTSTDNSNTTAATPAASGEGEIFTKRGCTGCHSISALGIKAGQVGPDLSKAYVQVADKHGMPIEEFLKKPNSAVMSSVLGSKPLTDDERAQVLAALKAASEK